MALPGQLIDATDSATVGRGMHVHGTHVVASIAGPIQTSSTATQGSNSFASSIASSHGTLLPKVGTVVLGKITRTTARQANLSILALGSTGQHVSRDAFPALIRQQDIRATEIDKVKVTESFRVGDVVRAVVLSLGDERSYYVSTAKNELGVVMATSEWGNQMYPISWKEFLDPETGIREPRKVAKPI